MITSITELAEHFSCARQTLYNWKAAGCPLDKGEDAIASWLAENRPEEESLAKQIQRAKLAKIEEETRDAKMKNDKQEGMLVDRADVLLEVNELVSLIKCRLESIPEEIVRELSPGIRGQVHEIVANRIHTTLIEMSQWAGRQPFCESPASPAAE